MNAYFQILAEATSHIYDTREFISRQRIPLVITERSELQGREYALLIQLKKEVFPNWALSPSQRTQLEGYSTFLNLHPHCSICRLFKADYCEPQQQPRLEQDLRNLTGFQRIQRLGRSMIHTDQFHHNTQYTTRNTRRRSCHSRSHPEENHQ